MVALACTVAVLAAAMALGVAAFRRCRPGRDGNWMRDDS